MKSPIPSTNLPPPEAMKCPQSIILDVANVTGVPAANIVGRRRTTGVVFARFLAVAAIKKEFPFYSLSDLAFCVRRRDHGSAKNSLIQFQNLCDTDPKFRAMAHDLGLVP